MDLENVDGHHECKKLVRESETTLGGSRTTDVAGASVRSRVTRCSNSSGFGGNRQVHRVSS